MPSPHAHYLCWRSGTMDRWECAASAEWLRKSIAKTAAIAFTCLRKFVQPACGAID